MKKIVFIIITTFLFLHTNSSLIEILITKRTLLKKINNVKLITKKNKKENSGRELLEKNPDSLINLLYFPKMENYESRILFEIEIKINEEEKNLQFFQYYNKLFLKQKEKVIFVCKISLENWNYLKLVYYNNDLRLLNFRTSSNFSDLKIFQKIKNISKKSISLNFVNNSNFYNFEKINFTKEKKIFIFQNKSYLPFIQELDMYYNNTAEFLIDNIQMPNFLNSKLKKVSKNYKKKSSKNIMITHDMKNGYKEDNKISLENPKKGFFYRFEFFMESNIFNYFSHHFITIPTTSYIKVCHDLGNKILGTIIVEYSQEHYFELIDDFENDKKIFFKLIKILEKKNFDGYLLNFESSSKNVDKIILWVSEFYKEIKKKNENYEIIWYDSLTKNGYVNWQGGINSSNSDFTKISDFFFLDYRWNIKKIEKSKNYVDSENKIMAGIDIWGRSSKYGGYETDKELDILKNNDKISIDLFAPAYSYEKGGYDLLENFEINQKKLWEGFEAKLLYDKISFDGNKGFFIDFENDLKNKSETFEYFFGFDIQSDGVEDIFYFGFLTFFENDEILGCLDTFRRKFIRNKNYCVYLQKEGYYRNLKTEKFNERLILEKSDFYEFKDKLTKIKFNLLSHCKNPKNPEKTKKGLNEFSKGGVYENSENCKKAKFSFFQIGELRQKNSALIKNLLTKKIVDLPINTFFNEGEGNNFFINGKKTSKKNYNYLLDYDINIELYENYINLSEKVFDDVIKKYIVKIDHTKSFFGTSSLKISGLLKKKNYLSHYFYNIQFPQKNFFIKICYKPNILYKKKINYEFRLINSQKYLIKPKNILKEKKNNWLCETRFYKTKIDNGYLILFAESKKDFILEENFFDFNIGQISIFENNELLVLEISKEFLEIKFKARKNFDENFFDLYINLILNDNSLNLKKCFLLKNGKFVHMLYFEEFVVKGLVVEERLDFKVYCISENGKFLPVKEHLVVKDIEEFGFFDEE